MSNKHQLELPLLAKNNEKIGPREGKPLKLVFSSSEKSAEKIATSDDDWVTQLLKRKASKLHW